MWQFVYNTAIKWLPSAAFSETWGAPKAYDSGLAGTVDTVMGIGVPLWDDIYTTITFDLLQPQQLGAVRTWFTKTTNADSRWVYNPTVAVWAHNVPTSRASRYDLNGGVLCGWYMYNPAITSEQGFAFVLRCNQTATHGTRYVTLQKYHPSPGDANFDNGANTMIAEVQFLVFCECVWCHTLHALSTVLIAPWCGLFYTSQVVCCHGLKAILGVSLKPQQAEHVVIQNAFSI